MKIDVITLHGVQNYGSVLQAYATQKLLESYGCDVTIIDYARSVVKYENLRKVWGKGNKLKELIMIPTILRWKLVFRGFCEKELNLSEATYTSSDDFVNFPLDADAYCTGSDQVWNSTWNDGVIPSLYLDFVPENHYKFALASSFGNENLSQKEIEKTKSFIHQYRHITVRETSGIDILKQQYDYNQCRLVLDPTLSFPAEFWREIASSRKIKYKYILIYNLNRSKEFDDYAKKLSKKTGLKLVRLCTRYDQILRSGKSILIPSIYEFISLIDNASFVLTDSFHATAFSMNMNTEPICVYPNNFSNRIDSFLKLVDSPQRKISSYNDFDVIKRKVDFTVVNKILNDERMNMKGYLKMIIDEINDEIIEKK